MKESATSASVEVESAIRAILIEELELEPDELTAQGKFVEDYDADSLTLITVVTRIERQLGVSIPGELQAELLDLQAVLTVIHSLQVE